MSLNRRECCALGGTLSEFFRMDVVIMIVRLFDGVRNELLKINSDL